MQTQTEIVDGVLVVSVDGRLVASCAEDFKTTMYKLMDDNKKICLDLQNMGHIDSSGIGALIHVLQKLNDDGGVMAIAKLQPKPKIVFDITKVYRIFSIHDTVEDAVSALNSAS